MLARTLTGTVFGIEARLVEVEVGIVSGLPTFTVVGLAHGAVREGRERVIAALRTVGFTLPPRRITVNLAPGSLKKEGTGLDLPIAVALMVAAGRIAPERAAPCAFLGELGLDGSLRPVAGVLPVAAVCADRGVRNLLLPEANAAEAAALGGIGVYGARSLSEVVAHLSGTSHLRPRERVTVAEDEGAQEGQRLDLGEVHGQETAKRALEVAAAGGHNLLLVGPPGAGKTMLARRLPTILPPLGLTEALDASRVHSVAGLLTPSRPLVARRPFRAPHHSVSVAGLAGGGAPPRPGEISLAHNGVLFLDELPEFRRGVLETLRQPLEEGAIVLSRAHGSVRFPARIQLIAAMNPCPCGYLGDGTDRCLCDPAQVGRYHARVSGPLLDRIDLHVQVPAVPVRFMGEVVSAEGSAAIRARVERARMAQASRFADVAGVGTNSQMGAAEVRRFCRLGADGYRLLERAVERSGLSARAFHRILKVARTLADLEGAVEIGAGHLAEAVQYRAWGGGRAGGPRG